MATDSEVMAGGAQIGEALSNVGQTMFGLSEYKRKRREEEAKKQAAQDLGIAVGNTSYGQTETGALAAKGLSAGLLDPDKTIGEMMKLSPEEILNFVITDPNIVNDPKKMAVTKKMIQNLAFANETQAFAKSKGNAMGEWYGPSGMNAKTAAARSSSGSADTKLEYAKPIDFGPVKSVLQQKYGEDMVMQIPKNKIPGFKGDDEGFIEVSLNENLLNAMNTLKEKNTGKMAAVGRFFGLDSAEQFTDEQLKGIHQYYQNDLFNTIKESIKLADPVYSNPALSSALDSVSARAFNRMTTMGVENAVLDKNNKTIYQMPGEKLPKWAFNTNEKASYLEAYAEKQVAQDLDFGSKIKKLEELKKTLKFSDTFIENAKKDLTGETAEKYLNFLVNKYGTK